MELNEIKKYLYKSKAIAKLNHYVSGNLYYTISLEDGLYQFNIPTVEEIPNGLVGGKLNVFELSSDLGKTIFNSEMKGSELIRWISKAIEKNEFQKIEYWKEK